MQNENLPGKKKIDSTRSSFKKNNNFNEERVLSIYLGRVCQVRGQRGTKRGQIFVFSLALAVVR